MQKISVMLLAGAMAFMFSSCGQAKDSGEVRPDTIDNISQNSKETDETNSAVRENNDIELDDKPEMNFTYDYSENIKEDIDQVVSGSASLQEELENIEKIIQKYTPSAEAARTQGEMNVSSQWFFVIWDTELGVCNSGKSIYQVLNWYDGEEAGELCSDSFTAILMADSRLPGRRTVK